LGEVSFLETKARYHNRKAQKIKGKKEISDIIRLGKKWGFGWCSVYYSKNKLNRSRSSIIINKTAGSAVERNKIKRYAREFLRYYIINSSPLHIDVLIKVHPAKDVNKSKYELEKILHLWLKSIKN
jgi:ribonuclease P protein component